MQSSGDAKHIPKSITFATLVAFAAALLFSDINRPFSYDELYTAHFFVHAHSLWHAVSTYLAFNNHIGFSATAWFFEQAFGPAEWVYRLPAALFGLLTLLALFQFARSISSSYVAFLACFLLILAPDFVQQSSLARGYSGLVFFSVLSTLAFLKLLRRISLPASLLFIVSNVLAGYFHLYGIFVPAAQVVVLVADRLIIFYKSPPATRSWTDNTKLSAVGVVIALLYAALYFPVLSQFRSALTHFAPTELRDSFFQELFRYFAGANSTFTMSLVGTFAILGAAQLFKVQRAVCFYFLLLPLIPLTAVLIFQPHFVYPRFFLYFTPFFVFLIALGITSVSGLIARRHAFLFYAVSTAFVAAIALQWAPQAFAAKATGGFRPAAAAMLANKTPNTALCGLGGAAPLYEFYTDCKIIVPSSFEEFLDLTKKYDAVNCGYSENSWQHAAHSQIADFLATNSEVEEFSGIKVFKYNRAKNVN